MFDKSIINEDVTRNHVMIESLKNRCFFRFVKMDQNFLSLSTEESRSTSQYAGMLTFHQLECGD